MSFAAPLSVIRLRFARFQNRAFHGSNVSPLLSRFPTGNLPWDPLTPWEFAGAKLAREIVIKREEGLDAS